MSQMLKLSQSKALGVRGKYAEDKVRDELKLESEKCADFDFERNYDGRSSMGRIPQRAGDFTFYRAGRHGVVEVKQVAHDFRVPRKNFDPARWGVLRKRGMAGGFIFVLVFHSTTRLWRAEVFSWFDAQRDVTSWDLSVRPAYKSAREALKSLGVLQ